MEELATIMGCGTGSFPTKVQLWNEVIEIMEKRLATWKM